MNAFFRWLNSIGKYNKDTIPQTREDWRVSRKSLTLPKEGVKIPPSSSNIIYKVR